MIGLYDLPLQLIIQLILALVLGGMIGMEREIKGKEAGLQTYSIVSLGSCLFTLVSIDLLGNYNVDPSRVIQAVAMGIGFIGAGVIFQRPDKIEGLTTAAGLWAAAGVGMAVGFGLYFLAAFTSLLLVIIFSGIGSFEKVFIEKKLKKKR